MSGSTYFGRSIDYIGGLGARLRDLRGFATLAHELIQNADDAPRVSSMCFDVCDDALIVDNDGVFLDCGEVHLTDCPWSTDPAHDNCRCDFHRFRLIESGDKRRQKDATGAFGIGFITVYQITDRPELISGGRHWILKEDAAEEKRIEECGGCQKCTSDSLPGTRFILPWAQDVASPLRKKLSVETVSDEKIGELHEEFRRVLPNALIFLKHLTAIELRRNGAVSARFERLLEPPDDLIVSDGQRNVVWRLFRGDFSAAEQTLRHKHRDRIEAKRSSRVVLAMPDERVERGLLYAVLPTQYETGLEFHINAEFFPTNDRKSIIFGEDYQAEWNEAAIDAAAATLGSSIGKIRDHFGHERLWEIIAALHPESLRAGGEQRGRIFSRFWQQVGQKIAAASLVYTSNGRWVAPGDVCYSERTEPVELLGRLGVSLVHPALRSYHNILRGDPIGVRSLDIQDIVRCLNDAGLSRRTSAADMPDPLKTIEAVRVLWAEIEALLARHKKPPDEKRDREILSLCAIALANDGSYWPIHEVYKADFETRDLFCTILPDTPFVEASVCARVIVDLCPEFAASVACQKIAALSAECLMRLTSTDYDRLLAWFSSRQSDMAKHPATREAIKELPIFPSAGRHCSLTRLALPGDFSDPIGIAEIVDLKRLGGRRDFLRELGCKELTFEHYAREFIPKAFFDQSVSDDKKQEVISLLAAKLGEIRDNEDVRQALANTPLIKCRDSAYRKPEEAYFDPEMILDAPSEQPDLPEHQRDAVRDLLLWLGVAEGPRPGDVARHITSLLSSPPDEGARNKIRKIFGYLVKCLKIDSGLRADLHDLRDLAWLPAVGDMDRWYRPDEIYATFQDYLFSSQVRFLDVPRTLQGGRDELDALGIRSVPSVAQVVRHLLWSADNMKEVNEDVYRFLNDNADARSLEELVGRSCICLQGGRYVRPSQVFWGEHRFGKYRYRLRPELRRYNDFFGRVGVREVPDHNDAFDVLGEISEECGANNVPPESETRQVVITCWCILQAARQANAIAEDDLRKLNDKKVIPRDDGLLERPELMFFEDRADLAQKFKDLISHNVIRRPVDGGMAMAEAGVRPLSQAVKARIVECGDQILSDDVTNRVSHRWLELARVLEGRVTGQEMRDRLAGSSYFSVCELTVLYEIDAFRQKMSSEPESSQALYDVEAKSLFFVPRNGVPPWPAIARELTLALFPDEEPGRIAVGIKEVLSANSMEDASVSLSELGFAKLDPAAVDLGENSAQQWGMGGNGIDAVSCGVMEDSAVPPDTSAADVNEGKLVHAQLADSFSYSSGVAGAAVKRPVGGRGSQLRSYVSDGSASGEQVDDPAATAHRSEIEMAGVNHVVEFEKKAGRSPTVMPSGNPGYDIESTDGSGVVRYIEVKSVAGRWGLRGVGLTKNEFATAREFGEQYWLYVVEEAKEPSARVYPIHNPAQRVDTFFFDDGWRGAADTYASGPH